MPTAQQLSSLSLPELLAQFPSSLAVLEQFQLAPYAKTEAAKHESIKASCLVVGVDADAVIAALEAVL